MRLNSLLLTFYLFAINGAFSQFGFERVTNIDLIKDEIIQKHAWAGGMDYCQFSNIDLDFDGVEDLFIFDRTCNKVLTFLQKGEAGEMDYEYAPEYEDIFPDDLTDWVLLVDYNCDGKRDLFTHRIGTCRVFKNVGNEEDGNLFELEELRLTTTIYDSEGIMYFARIDIPAFVDIDGDNDIDILHFGLPGQAVEYRKNLSMELYGNCDSLEYETKNICWGRFRESGATNEVTLWDTLNAPCRDTDLTDEFVVEGGLSIGDRHAGSSILALDMDNSGVMDLIIGDISYNNLVMLLNSGTEVNANSGMMSQDVNFPSTSVSVDLPVYPAAYHVDINNDAIRDLVVTPSSRLGSENVKGTWLYLNENEDTSPDFVYEENAFLQGKMLDVGTSSTPVFFDHNGDGLLDLLVSSQGKYVEGLENPLSQIAYFENTGTAEAPEFTLMDEDYQNISDESLELGFRISFYPTFGDLDGDGDEDMVLGEYEGYLYYSENTGGVGNPAIFNTFAIINNSEGSPIFSGIFTYPHLVDLDRDGDQDLVVGKRDGKLSYYRNTSSTSFNFEFVTDALGGVDVSGSSIEGMAVPQFIEIDDEYKLVVGSKSGYLYYYDDIEDNITGTFHLVDVSIDNLNIGTYSAPALANLNGNNRYEMALGNRRGGVGFFTSAPTNVIGLEQEEATRSIEIYPNPANDVLTIDLGSISAKELSLVELNITDFTGKKVFQMQPTTNVFSVSIDHLAQGTYVVSLTGRTFVNTKLVVQ